MPAAQALRLAASPAARDRPHDAARAAAVMSLQRSLGNRALQAALSAAGAGPLRAGPGAPSVVPSSIEQFIEASRGRGFPMDPATLTKMEAAFGRDFSGVLLHTDAAAGAAAQGLGADAFTVGTDIYFAQGRYQPGTRAGDHLLSHELTHTVQQGGAPPSLGTKMTVGSAADPEEREAEQVASRVAGGPKASTPGSAASPGPAVRRQEEGGAPAPPEPAGGGEEAGAESGDLVIQLGDGVRIAAADLQGPGGRVEVDLSQRPPSVPGLKLDKLVYRTSTRKGEIQAEIDIPFAKAVRGGVKVTVDADGAATLEGQAKLPFEIGVLRDPEIRVSIDETHQLAGSLSLTAGELTPKGIPKLKVEGGGEIHLERGRLGGSVEAKLDYEGLGKGDFHVAFEDGVPSGGGAIEITQKLLEGASASLAIDKGDLTADVAVPAAKLAPPVPGLEIPEGTIQICMNNSELSGTITGLHLIYKELGEGTLEGQIAKDHVEGHGTFTVNVPALEPVTGEIGYKSGNLHGKATVTAASFPESLPVKNGSITAGIDENADITFNGSVGVEFGGVGSGELRGAYEEGKLALGADVQLRVPGLSEIAAKVDYVDGKLEGEVDVPVDGEKLAGISGNLHVEYRDEKWKAEQQIGYERDDGKLQGSITLGLMQKEDGALAVYGGGDVTAQLTDFLAGELKVDVLPEGTTTVHGAIRVTEPIEMFPEKKAEKELFSISKNIPLWAILVAVIRLRAGVRAGVGPGQFRDITVEGEYTFGEESQPSFTISGEMFIPAFAEAYVAFGAGLGLDVILGSLTGGIEAIGTAGIYGAVSVIPELAYRDGDYGISGTATMAAAAKLKLGLEAWAEVEACWITVWENTWKLAEWVWDVGPTLALQANVDYVFGRPEPPSFEFKTSDIDAERLIQDAMPKEGPKGSGAREALKNRAEWSGRTKGKGKSADEVPPEAEKNKTEAEAPKAPPKPPKAAKPGAEEDKGKAAGEKGGKATPELEKTVDAAAAEETEKKGAEPAAPVPAFPAPGQAELDINWANYLEETKGSGMDRASFDGKMARNEVYHPKFRAWKSLEADWLKANPTLKEHEKEGRYFASKMRGGYYAGSLERDAEFDPNAEAHTGKQNDPYPIHWPTEFLVSSFEKFSVADGRTIPPTPRNKYSIDAGTRTFQYSFGVAGEFVGRMAIGQVFSRQDPGRNPSLTATEWDHWRNVGFSGGGATAPSTVQKPSLHGTGQEDSSLFGRYSLPNGEPITSDERMTFGTFIERGEDQQGRFSAYRNLRGVDKTKFRTAARAGDFDIMNPGDVRAYADYLNKEAEAAQAQRGVLGYEMQHVIPLFLEGKSGDTPENMWPLAVSQHRRGHDVLKKQPQIKTWGATTDNIESADLIGTYFKIRKFGDSL